MHQPRPLKILLAEDNPVNQQLAMALLEKRGHSVTVAGNGLEAVDAVGRERFDLVLMDVQMPEMDGLEATRRIRKIELQTGRQTPILALTAHALDVDRAQCLEAGMDAYFTKPIAADRLFAGIDSLMKRESNPGLEQEAALDNADVFDRAALLERVDGDPELQKEIVRLFLDDVPVQLHQIRCAVTAGDAQSVCRLAHTLKGVASIMQAGPTVEASLRLERVCRDGEMAAATEALDRLTEEVNRLTRALGPLAD